MHKSCWTLPVLYCRSQKAEVQYSTDFVHVLHAAISSPLFLPPFLQNSYFVFSQVEKKTSDLPRDSAKNGCPFFAKYRYLGLFGFNSQEILFRFLIIFGRKCDFFLPYFSFSFSFSIDCKHYTPSTYRIEGIIGLPDTVE